MINFINIIANVEPSESMTITFKESEYFSEKGVYMETCMYIDALYTKAIVFDSLLAEAGSDSISEKVKNYVMAAYKYIKKIIENAQKWIAKKLGIEKKPSGKIDKASAGTFKKAWDEMVAKMTKVRDRMFHESDTVSLDKETIDKLRSLLDSMIDGSAMAKFMDINPEDLKMDKDTNAIITSKLTAGVVNALDDFLEIFKSPSFRKYTKQYKIISEVQDTMKELVGTEVLNKVIVNSYFKSGIPMGDTITNSIELSRKMYNAVFSGASQEECKIIADDIVKFLNSTYTFKTPITLEVLSGLTGVRDGFHEFITNTMELTEVSIPYPNMGDDILSEILSNTNHTTMSIASSTLKKISPNAMKAASELKPLDMKKLESVAENVKLYYNISALPAGLFIGVVNHSGDSENLGVLSCILSVICAITKVVLSKA